jgi:glycosyltransferase involved in cell wall biosynthesis
MSANSLDVVIPTHNRGAALAETVSRVLNSDLAGLGRLEVIVVDDGSSQPAADALARTVAPSGVSLHVMRQANAGPARARNAGYRAGTGEIVLFMDDDILPPADLLRRHVAAHSERPGSVICGPCDWRTPDSPGALFRLLRQLNGACQHESPAEYRSVSIVASGQLSVERQLFTCSEGVYRDDLITPAAEEYELSLRLRRRGIPIVFAERIVAGHDTSTALADVCRQQYKHGVGCGEAARRCPDTLELDELAQIVRASRRLAGLKRVATSQPVRALVLEAARLAERLGPQVAAFTSLYRLAISVHFIAGVRDGLDRFSAVSSC